jgi:hypothetical protein
LRNVKRCIEGPERRRALAAQQLVKVTTTSGRAVFLRGGAVLLRPALRDIFRAWQNLETAGLVPDPALE